MTMTKVLFNKPEVKAALATGAVLATGFAHADAGDGGAVALLTAAATTVGLVGAASLAVYGAIKVFKLIRAAL